MVCMKPLGSSRYRLAWVCCLLAAAALAACALPQAGVEPLAPAMPEAASGWQAKSGLRAQRWMVAAANPLAADAGQAVLREGGSALDAAIAVQMVLTLVEPQSSGIGG